MRFFDAAESAKILERSNRSSEAPLELRVDFSDCLDRSAPLSRLIVSMLGQDQPNFLWIREFGIWPSLENWDLFNSLRAASGSVDQSLSEVPGHEFAPNEFGRTVSYLQIVLLNGWGGVLIGPGNQQRIAISHDSWLFIKLSAELPAQKILIDEFGLPSRLEQAPRSLVAVQVD